MNVTLSRSFCVAGKKNNFMFIHSTSFEENAGKGRQGGMERERERRGGRERERDF